MQYEVNTRPFDEHEMVDDIIEADNALQAAERFALTLRVEGKVTVYVRPVGTSDTPKRLTIERWVMPIPDSRHIEAVAFRLHQAAFFAQRPERASHVLAKEWMTEAFKHGGNIEDFETRFRTQLLCMHFDMFVADCIRERCHERN